MAATPNIDFTQNIDVLVNVVKKQQHKQNHKRKPETKPRNVLKTLQQIRKFQNKTSSCAINKEYVMFN